MTLSQSPPGMLRPGDDAGGPIIQVGPERRLEAVRRMVANGPDPADAQARRFLAYAETNAVGLDLMWARLDARGRIAHTVLAVRNTGRTAIFFASHIRRPDDVAALGAVVATAAAALEPLDCDLAQVLLEPAETLDQEAFLCASFVRLAALGYLERPNGVRRGPSRAAWAPPLTVETFDPDRSRDELLGILRATYRSTLDCPGLTGLRRTEDILAGHMATGRFDPDLWFLLRESGRGVGAILLNPSNDGRSIELVYLGLAPEVRGRGLGSRLLDHGLAAIAARRERRVTLAVDEDNAPALALYRGAGFRRVLRRVALVRSVARR